MGDGMTDHIETDNSAVIARLEKRVAELQSGSDKWEAFIAGVLDTSKLSESEREALARRDARVAAESVMDQALFFRSIADEMALTGCKRSASEYDEFADQLEEASRNIAEQPSSP